MAVRGIYRTHTPESGAEYARVEYGTSQADDGVTRARYEAQGYKPEFGRLPTKEVYETCIQIGFAPKGQHEADIAYAPTAKEALREIKGLTQSDEEIRFIKAPNGGREIAMWELEEMADREGKNAQGS